MPKFRVSKCYREWITWNREVEAENARAAAAMVENENPNMMDEDTDATGKPIYGRCGEWFRHGPMDGELEEVDMMVMNEDGDEEDAEEDDEEE